jgi:hypothetical protein
VAMSANRLKKGPHAVNISVACHGVVLGRLVERGVSKIISGVEDGANGGASVPQGRPLVAQDAHTLGHCMWASHLS